MSRHRRSAASGTSQPDSVAPVSPPGRGPWPTGVLGRVLVIVVLAAVTASASGRTAAFSQTQPAQSQEVVAAVTGVATFFGAGVAGPEISGPGPVVLPSWPGFADNVTDPSPGLALAVYAYFENGGPGVQVVLTPDDTPSSLVAAMAAFVPPEPTDRVAGDVFAVPALAGFSGADYDQVATGLVAVAEAANGIALLDPPAGTVQEVVETDDVTPLLDAAEHLRSVLPPDQQYRAVLYGNRVVTPAGSADWLPGAPAAGTTVPLVGLVAGVFASNDNTRGVWTAPAGTSANLVGVGYGGAVDLEFLPTNEQAGQLNVEGVNAVMALPGYGPVVWGARTVAGTDLAGSPWKYVSTRRLANFIEHSLEQSLAWCVFEPNLPPLWQAVDAETTEFLSGLYGQGAFGGATAAAAFQVAVDATTMTPVDIDTGRLVGQVKYQTTNPAEFFVLAIDQQCAGGAL